MTKIEPRKHDLDRESELREQGEQTEQCEDSPHRAEIPQGVKIAVYLEPEDIPDDDPGYLAFVQWMRERMEMLESDGTRDETPK